MRKKIDKAKNQHKQEPLELVEEAAITQVEAEPKNKQEKGIKYRSYNLSKRMGIKR